MIPDLLRLNGGKPLRLATFSWALGAFLAALAGILITPILGGSLDPNQLTLLVIDAFAAAVFGRLRSVPRTFAGAIIIGLADNYVVGYLGDTPLVSHFRDSLSMILLFIALLLLPSDRLRGPASYAPGNASPCRRCARRCCGPSSSSSACSCSASSWQPPRSTT